MIMTVRWSAATKALIHLFVKAFGCELKGTFIYINLVVFDYKKVKGLLKVVHLFVKAFGCELKGTFISMNLVVFDYNKKV